MLPLVDTPSIQIIVEECVAAGIEEIIFVTARGKSALEDHFDRAPELEALLERRGKKDDLARVQRAERSWRGSRRCGRGRRAGSGTRCSARGPPSATSRSRCCWATICSTPKVPGIGQLIEVYQRLGTGVVALKEVPADQTHLYGIADGARDGARGLKIDKLIEKPAPGTTTSRAAVIGRYVLPPEIFAILAETPPGRGGEIQLTDGLATLCARRGLYGLEVEGDRFDVGDRAGYVVAMVHYALRRPDIADDVRAGIEKLLAK